MHFSVTVRVTLAVLGACAVTAALPRILPQQELNGTVRLLSRGSPPLDDRVPACNYGGQPYFFVATEDPAHFNVTPETWDMRAFDPRCQPRPLVDELLDTNATSDGQLSIMLYGDRCAHWHTPALRMLRPPSSESAALPPQHCVADRWRTQRQ